MPAECVVVSGVELRVPQSHPEDNKHTLIETLSMSGPFQGHHHSLNPLSTSPEYTRAGVNGKCVL